MASHVYYRFKSQPDTSTIAFDGTGISVWELKKEILAANNLGKAADFDFHLLDPDTEQEYRNDDEIIPRASTVIARRLPAAKRNAGTALKYTVIEGAAAAALTNAQNARANYGGGNRTLDLRGQNRQFMDAEPQYDAKEQITSTAIDDDEAAKLGNFFAQTGTQWEQEQAKMLEHKRYINPRGPAGGARPSAFNKPLPRGFVCHRCYVPGHHIRDCPLHDDPNATSQRVAKLTGIPRSFQVAISKDEITDGAMVDADGNFYMVRPDLAGFQAQRQSNITAEDVQESQPTDPDLTCPIDNKLLHEAVTVPCCNATFCDECIRTHLAANSNVCPECETKLRNLTAIKPDEGRRQRVKEYVESILQATKAMAKSEGDVKVDDEASRASSTLPGVKSEEGANGTPQPGQPVNGAARPPPRPVDTVTASQNAQSQKLFQLMMLLANPDVVGPERAQLQTMLGSMSYVDNNVKGVYRPGAAPPSFAPSRPAPLAPHQLPTGPRHAVNSYQGSVPTGPRGPGGRGHNPFGLPQQQPPMQYNAGATGHQQYQQAQPYQTVGGYQYGGIKRERPPDFVTLGGDKSARLEY